MGRNNGDFKEGITPDVKDIMSADVKGKITWEEAEDLSPEVKKLFDAHRASNPEYGKKQFKPSTKAQIKSTHKKAGLKDEE